MLKQLFTSFLAILWISVANHCYVGSAFAAPVKAAHHCGGTKNQPVPGGPHDRCTKGVCCESFSPMTAGTQDMSVPTMLAALPYFSLSFLGADIPLGSLPRFTGSPRAHGPPALQSSLVMSLTLAQNAPPI